MSDQQLTDQQPQAKRKHAGGRPKKPQPAPPPPPPAPRSLEETLVLGDEAALEPGATAASRLRWYSDRAQIIRDIQAKADADLHDALEIDNKRLLETVGVLDRTRQKLESKLGKKESELAEARTENDKMAAKMKEMTEEHAKASDELTNKMRARQRNAQGLLALVRCACSQMKHQSEGQRIEYAARLMSFSEQAFKQCRRLAELVKNAEAHREHYSTYYWNLRQGAVEQKCTSEQFAQIMRNQEEEIERFMQADRERLAIENSNIIPDEAMNQAFELLGVTREQVVTQLDTEREERKA